MLVTIGVGAIFYLVDQSAEQHLQWNKTQTADLGPLENL